MLGYSANWQLQHPGFSQCQEILENHMGKKMENEMETATYKVL